MAAILYRLQCVNSLYKSNPWHACIDRWGMECLLWLFERLGLWCMYCDAETWYSLKKKEITSLVDETWQLWHMLYATQASGYTTDMTHDILE